MSLALDSMDFNAVSEDLTFTESVLMLCVDIDIIGDSLPEDSESFSVQLSIATMLDRLTISPNITTVTIGG